MKKTFHPSSSLRHLGAACAVALLLAACGGGSPEAMLGSAKDYLARNDTKAAVIELKNALQKEPDLAEARFLLGSTLLAGGDFVGAETELRKAQSLKYADDEVVPALAQAMLGLRQFKKITDEFGATSLAKPQAQARLKTYLVGAYAGQGDESRAEAALGAALAADPQYAPALLIKARAEAARRNVDGALGIVEGVLAAAPGNADALKMRGDLKLFGKEDEAGAMADYRKAIEINPGSLDAHAALLAQHLRKGALDDATKDLEALKKAAPASFQARYFDTLLALQKKDLPRARDLAQQLLRVAPNSVMALQLAGSIEQQSGNLLQADVHLSKAVQTAPESVLARRELASVYLRSGQLDKAMATLQPLIRAASTDAASNALIGQAYLQTGDTKKAEEYFAKATKQDPSNTRNRVALALSQLASGKAEAGLGELQDIAASDKGTTADMALISSHLRRQEYDKAMRAIDALEKKQPQSPLPSDLRGRLLLAKKDVAGARKHFERALQISPEYFASLSSLAALDVAEKKPEEARKRFEAALQKNPKNGPVLIALAELKAIQGGTPAEVAQLLTRAVDANPTDRAPRRLLVELHLRTKNFEQAKSVAQAAVSAFPDNPEMLDALGQVQQATGDTNQALTSFSRVATLQPSSPLPQMRLAAAHLAAKDRASAQQSLRKALDIKSDFLEAQTALVAMAVEDKNFDEAIRIARTIQKQRPKEDSGYRMEGDIAMVRQNWDVALAAYNTGLKAAPTPAMATKVVGAMVASGRKPEADAFSANWAQTHPQDAAFRMFLADAAIGTKNYAVAEKWYQDVLKIQANNALAYNNLAWVSGQQKKDVAIGYAEKANALAPNQPAFIDTLAMLLSEKNEHARAIELQKKVLSLQPDNPVFKTNMARIYIHSGQKDLARKQLEEVAKLGDKYRGQAEVSALLKTL